MAGSLDSAEQNIVEALEVAAELAENLGARAQIGGDAKANEAACEQATAKFLTLMQQVHGTMSAHTHKVSNYRPYCRSSYGAQTDASISGAKLELVRSLLREIKAVDGGDTTPVME
jgi:hypothetical protein